MHEQLVGAVYPSQRQQQMEGGYYGPLSGEMDPLIGAVACSDNTYIP